ncbi:superoxide dismutase family protein [Gordonia sp. NPDC003376]
MTVSSKSGRQTVRALAVLASAGAIGLALAGCTPDEPTTTEKGTTPAVITGNPAPSVGIDDADGIPPTGQGEVAVAAVKTVAGKQIGEVTFTTGGDKVSVAVKIDSGSGLTAGQHGIHVHTGTSCTAADEFASAGGHLQVDGHTGQPESGDLGTITVSSDGAVTTTITTTTFTVAQADGHALVIHDTGADAERRVACGVVETEHS